MDDENMTIRIGVTVVVTPEQYELLARHHEELTDPTPENLSEVFSDALASYCGILEVEEGEALAAQRQLELTEQKQRQREVRAKARQRGLRIVK